MKPQFTVRWTDSEQKYRTKDYSTYKQASDALKWLIKQGCEDADIAYIYRKPQTTTLQP